MKINNMAINKKSFTIKVSHEGEDYISVEINGVEKEIYKHDGQAINDLLKVINIIFNAYK